MKKNFYLILMGLVIFSGIMFTATPFIYEYVFKNPDMSREQASAEAAQQALGRWFHVEPGAVVDVTAMRKIGANGNRVGRFSFSTQPDTVRRFIASKGLKQYPLTAEVMEKQFSDKDLPWWQPEALSRETWFGGFDGEVELSLIYNDQTSRGVLVIHQQSSD